MLFDSKKIGSIELYYDDSSILNDIKRIQKDVNSKVEKIYSRS